jgi:hypothetical protein
MQLRDDKRGPSGDDGSHTGGDRSGGRAGRSAPHITPDDQRIEGGGQERAQPPDIAMAAGGPVRECHHIDQQQGSPRQDYGCAANVDAGPA